MSENDSILPPAAAPPPPPPPPPPADDPGSQALSDALRSSFFIVKIIMVGLVIVFLCSGIFTVGSQQRAIRLQMGNPVGKGTQALYGPGIHFAWPKPIDEVVMIPFSGIQHADSTIGWDQTPEERMKNADPPPALPSLDPRSVSYALTSDTNIVLVSGTMQFSVNDPIRFQFDFTDSLAFVTNDLNNALLFASSQFTVDEILTSKVGAFKDAVERRVKQLIEQQQLGVTVLQVDVGKSPPRYLAAKFQGVNKANTDREKIRDQAITYATNKVTYAIAEGQSQINNAEVERARAVGTLSAYNTNFTRFRSDFERDPEMFKTMLLMPAMERVLAGAKEITMEPHQSGRQMRLHVGSEPLAPPAQTNQVQ